MERYDLTLPRTGFIDHIGIGVPDLVAAKEYYDELMSVLWLRDRFATLRKRARSG